MNNNRLFRNTHSKVIGGVASGIADYLNMDVTVVRVILVLSFFIPKPFPIVLIYIVLWIVMPVNTTQSKHFGQSHPIS